MPKLNTAALKRLILERYDGVQQKFLDEFSLTRKTIGKWYADGVISDKRMQELCDHFSVDQAELDLEKDDIDMEQFVEIYEELAERCKNNGVEMDVKSLMHWTGVNYKNYFSNGQQIDMATFDMVINAVKGAQKE